MNKVPASTQVTPFGTALAAETAARIAGDAAQAAAILAGDTAILRTAAEGDPNIPQSMIVTGTLTDGTDPVVFPVLPWNEATGSWGAFPSGSTTPGSQPYELAEVEGQSYRWLLIQRSPQAIWTSTADVATPALVPAGAWHETENPDAWKPSSPANGTPIVTADPPLQGTTPGQLLRLATADPDDGVYRWFVWSGSTWSELALL